MFKNPFGGFDFGKPFARKRARNLFGYHTTPRDFKHGARDIPFGMGAASLYVDGTDGHDSNDGESWKTATKTIQAAIDAADHWTNIFIKPGAYAEAAHVDSKHGISLIGATRAGVHITAPGGGNAFTSSAVSFADALSGQVANLKATGGAHYYGIYAANSDLLQVENCYCYSCYSGIKLYNSDDVIVYNNVIDGNNLDVGAHGGVYIDSNSLRTHVYQNTISNYTGTGSGARIYGEDCRFHDNTITSVYHGIHIQPAVTIATIFHNNLITCSDKYINDASTIATVFENYYSVHSNVDNGFGIAKAPYAYTGGTDPRPVVVRNGWLGLSWADADTVADILEDVTGIAGAAMRGTDNAALASVCTEARLAELDAANLPADIADLITRTKGLDDIHDDLVTVDTVVDSILANQKKFWHWTAIVADSYEEVTGTWTWSNNTNQHLGGIILNDAKALNDEIAIPFFARSTDAVTLNIRGATYSDGGIATIYIDGASQGTIDWYSASVSYNVIRTISITPARVGMNIIGIKLTSKDGSSSAYGVRISEMWLS